MGDNAGLKPGLYKTLDDNAGLKPGPYKTLEDNAGLKPGPYKTLEDNAGLKSGPYKTLEEDYRFAPKASRRPSQSFTTNSRVCHGMLPSPRVNSTPWAAYSE